MNLFYILCSFMRPCLKICLALLGTTLYCVAVLCGSFVLPSAWILKLFYIYIGGFGMVLCVILGMASEIFLYDLHGFIGCCS